MVSTSFHFWFSRKSDLRTLPQHSYFLSSARVDGAYERKSEKIQPVDLDLSDVSKLDGSDAC